MNVFSNIGITELLVIFLLALLVVGPERLPELGRKLGKTLRDVRKAYENLTRDLGPELAEIQKSTQELRESVESVRSIPQDVVQTVVKAADLDDTIQDLKEVTGSVEEIGQTLSVTGKTIKDPLGAAVDAARSTLVPQEKESAEGGKDLSAETAISGDGAEDSGAEDSGPQAGAGTPSPAVEEEGSGVDEGAGAAAPTSPASAELLELPEGETQAEGPADENPAEVAADE